jgi:Transposase DDE domain group 1
LRIYFRADAGFANPDVYEFLQAERIKYAIRLPANRVLQRGTCEQWIEEGKGAIKWTRLSCRSFAANAVRLQLHALAYNLGNFLRTLATPKPIKDWSLTTLKEKPIKIGGKVVSHGRYVAFQMAEVAIPRNLFADILRLIAELRPPPAAGSKSSA